MPGIRLLKKKEKKSEPLRCLSAVSTQSILTGLISFELISLRRERSSSEMNSIFTSNSLHGHYNAARELASSESDSHRFMKTSFRMEQSVSSSSVWLLFHVTCITYVFSVSFLIPHSSHAHFYKHVFCKLCEMRIRLMRERQNCAYRLLKIVVSCK